MRKITSSSADYQTFPTLFELESCIKDPRWEPMIVHSQTEMLGTNVRYVVV